MIPHSRPTITDEDVAGVVEQLRSGMLAEGEAAARVESWFAAHGAAAGAVAVGSGCQGLLLALRALGVRAGDEVILPTLVCPEVWSVVDWCGAKAVVVDVDEDYLLSLEAARAALSPRTRAIILPYVLGIHRDPAPLRSLGVPVLEDCAQYLDPARMAGALLGDAVVYSFEATKVLAAGEGGLVLTRRDDVARALRAAKRCGKSGGKLNLFPLSDLQARLALTQLGQIDAFLARRRTLAQRYLAAFEGHPSIAVPHAVRTASMFFRLPLQMRAGGKEEVDALIERCAARGVSVRRPVDRLVHRLPGVRAQCLVAEDLHARTFSVPLYPALSDEDAQAVVRAVLDSLP
ncbi:MAG: DegT/DnrJ/EryC1/StrS family aminotransferase [Gammaproteobacteria bacterium]